MADLFVNLARVDKTVRSGSLLQFNYPRSMARRPGIIHDTRPLVIVSDIGNVYLRGVNLHYLTLPYIKFLINQYASQGHFSYQNIKYNSYIANAFRTYRIQGIFNPRKLNTEFLQKVLTLARSLNPYEIEKIRMEIERQINQPDNQPSLRPQMTSNVETSAESNITPGQESGVEMQ